VNKPPEPTPRLEPGGEEIGRPQNPRPEGPPSPMGPELVDLDELAPEAQAPPSAERRRGPRFTLFQSTLLLSIIALVGGFLVVNLILMPSFTRQGAEVPVPEVTGFSELQAERALAGEGLKLSKISEQWSPDVPRGFVIGQDPPSGSTVKRGRRISVIVSLGAQGTSVPVVTGGSVRQAEIVLEGGGLKAGRIAHAWSEEMGKDLVLATDPPGETLVDQETPVNLLVSLGAPARSYVLPDLRGQDPNAVARTLRQEGFEVFLHPGGRGSRDGIISEQDPPAGARIASRDSIRLWYPP
jgi:eukaryotic-like serine/threonine-protein kinase